MESKNKVISFPVNKVYRGGNQKMNSTMNAPATIQAQPTKKPLPKVLRDSRILNRKVTREEAETALYPSNSGYSLGEIYEGLAKDDAEESGANQNGTSK